MRAISVSLASSDSDAAATLSVTRANSRITRASISSSSWWNPRRSSWRGSKGSDTAAPYRGGSHWGQTRTACPSDGLSGAGGQVLDRVRPQALVVDLAIGRPADGVDDENPPR